MWKNIEAAPADAILGLTEAFKNDDNNQKVNLGVGVYKDDQGNTPILSCIKTAENLLLEDQITKGYLPIPGTAEYGLNVQGLLFGEDSEVISSKRASTIQSPGGTGGLRVIQTTDGSGNVTASREIRYNHTTGKWEFT